MNRAWITGAGGLIGSYLARTASGSARQFQAIPLTRVELDLLDFLAVRRSFRRDSPALIIHCAALSKTPACEKNPDLAWRLNVEVTRVLCELANDIPLLFFSTDLLFDGRTGNYDETATPNPLSVYGKTKVAAERLVLANPKHTVIRTSLNAGKSTTGDRGFNEQLRKSVEAGQPLRLFIDEFRAPIAAEITARAAWELAVSAEPGLYHVAGSERLSRWQIGRLLTARWPQLNAHIEPASLKEYTGPPRMPDTFLDCRKAQRCLSFKLPGFTEWLRAHPEAEI